jgi:adenylosuccinate synthase
VLLRFAVNVNGITELGLTKLDILTGMPSIKICTAYHICGEKVVELPMCFGTEQDEDIEPVYDELPGWQQDVRKARRWEELPLEAQRFIGQIEELSGVPVKTISVGPERSQVIIRS